MIANSIICMGSARILQKLYTNDLAVSGTTSFSSLAVSGNATVGGTLGVTGNTTLSTMTATGTVVLSKTTDLSGTADNAPALIVGGTRSQAHLEFDANEIQAKNSSTTIAKLSINYDGGIVALGTTGKVTVDNGTLTTPNLTVSTSASIASLTSPKIVADNVNVLDTLRATKFEWDSISQVGGSMYISPTIIFSSSTTVAITAISGTTVTAAFIDSNSINTDTIGGVQWTQYSKIKISGRLGNTVLGNNGQTCTGTLTAKMNTTAGRINCTFTCDNASELSVKTYATSEVHDLRVMIYEKGINSTTSYPVGMLLTGYGTNNNSYIDIYQGEDSRTKPRVRLGKLDGLDSTIKIGDATPTGWGLFADNTYLKGVIYATAGVMGGWKISEDRIYHTGNTPSNANTVLSPGGVSSTTSIGGSSGTNTWAFTIKNIFGVTTGGALYSSSGKIGGWTIGTSDLHNGTTSMTNTTAGIYLGTGGIRNYKDADTYVNITNGVITAKAVDLSGKITATSGFFGGDNETDGWVISTGKIYSKYTTSSDEIKYVGMGTLNKAWAFFASSSTAGGGDGIFRVSHSGILYATNAHITGEVTATSGTIGGWTIKENYLATGTTTTPSANSMILSPEGTSVEYTVAGQKSTGWMITAGTTFGVNKNGGIYATSGKIGGWTIGTNNIHNGTSSMTSTTAGIFIGTGGIRNYKDANTYVNITSGKITAIGVDLTGKITATDGAIGGWTIDSNSIYTGTKETGVADGDITLKSADFSRTINGTSRSSLRFAIGGNFGVDKTGAIYASSGNIGGFTLDGDSLYTGTKGDSIADGSITFSTADFTRTINGVEREHLRFAVGKGFAIRNDGYVYILSASVIADLSGYDATFDGTVNGLAGIFGGFKMSQGYLYSGNTLSSANFSVSSDGNMKVKSGTFGDNITLTTDGFYSTSFNNVDISGDDVYSDSLRVSQAGFSRHMVWHDPDVTMGKIHIAIGDCFAVRGDSGTNQLSVDIFQFRYRNVLYDPSTWASTDKDTTFTKKITITGGANTSGSAALNPGLTVKDIMITGRISNKFANDNTHASAIPLGIYNAGTDKYIFYKISSSSIRYKDVGHKLTSKDIDKLYNVNVYNAKYKDGYLAEGDELEGKYFPMFIAEEIEKVLPEAVIHVDGKVENWNDRVMIPTMFQMIKSQKEQIDRLENELKKLKESR